MSAPAPALPAALDDWPGPRPLTRTTALAWEGTMVGAWEALTFDVAAACRAVYLVHAAAWQSQVLDRHARLIRRARRPAP